MKVQIRDIPCHKALDVEGPFVAEALAGLPLRNALERPAGDPEAGAAHAELDLTLEGENVFVRGPLRGHVVVACSRCVGPARIAVEDDLAVTFMPRGDVPAEPERDAEPADNEETAAVFEED